MPICRAKPLGRGLSRLATVRRLALPALALALGGVAAFSLVSCGGGEDAKLLPGSTAREINENLDRVRQLAAEGECVGAADAVQEVSAQVESLGGVDVKLKEALQRGTVRLQETIATCEEATIETTEATEETTETTKPPPGHEKHKVPPGQEKKQEREVEETTETTPTTPVPPAEESPPPVTPPGEGGGTGAPGGIGPGNAVGGGD